MAPTSGYSIASLEANEESRRSDTAGSETCAGPSAAMDGEWATWKSAANRPPGFTHPLPDSYQCQYL
jgi:hypothetical protein